MSIDADALRALSERATQGEWHVDWLPAWNEDNGAEEPPVCDGICIHTPEHEAESVLCCSEREAAFIAALVNAYRSGDLVHRSKISEETARAGEAMRKRCLGLVQVEIDAVSCVEADLIATGGENDSLSYAGHRASLQMMAAAIRALPLTEEAAHANR